MEPTGGFSTYCRRCGKYYRITQPAAQKPSWLKSLFVFGKPENKTPAPQLGTGHRPPSLPLRLEGFSEEAAELMATASPDPAAPSKLQKRPVVCFDCRTVHEVSRSAISSLCPACSCYIDLRDVTIRDTALERIRTRGDVTVEKHGVIAGSSTTCGNLELHGDVQGSIYASGNVHLMGQNVRIRGEVRCRELIIHRRTRAQFGHVVHCENAQLDGHASGKFIVANKLVLSAKATLQGSVEAKSVTMPPGAVVNGPLIINPKPKVNLHAPTTSELEGKLPPHQNATSGAAAEVLPEDPSVVSPAPPSPTTSAAPASRPTSDPSVWGRSWVSRATAPSILKPKPATVPVVPQIPAPYVEPVRPTSTEVETHIRSLAEIIHQSIQKPIEQTAQPAEPTPTPEPPIITKEADPEVVETEPAVPIGFGMMLAASTGSDSNDE